jgi:AcrR family transcriptional regulator
VKPQSKRLAIMEAAEKLFRNRRIHEITLDEIAQKAGVGKGTIYLYFTDKDDLFFQVATSGFDELCELVGRKVNLDDSIREQLLGVCTSICDYFEARLEMFLVIQAQDVRMATCKESLRERWLRHRTKLVESVAAVLQRGVSAGEIRGDVSAGILAQILFGMLRTRNVDLRGMPTEERGIEMIVDLFCVGVGAHAHADKNDVDAFRAEGLTA